MILIKLNLGLNLGIFSADSLYAAVRLDLPADRHQQGANLSFADGHSEHWRWKAPKQFVTRWEPANTTATWRTFSGSSKRQKWVWMIKPYIRPISLALGVLALWAALAAQAASPVITGIAMVPRLTVQSDTNVIDQIQYTTNLSQPVWTTLTNLTVTQSPYWFADLTAPPAPARYYRVSARRLPAAWR